MQKTRENFISNYGLDYLNILLERIKSQKEYSKLKAPQYVQHWRKQELIVRKCIALANDFSNEF